MDRFRIFSGVAAFLACFVLPLTPMRAEVHKTNQLSEVQKTTRLLILEKQEIGQVPVTKLGGVPWWPKGSPRPECSRKHQMSFVGQVHLSDVPELGPTDNTLLSFHYCMTCTWTGYMSWGDTDASVKYLPPGYRGYQIDLFEKFDGVQADGRGEIVLPDPLQTEERTPFPPRRVAFRDFREVPDSFEKDIRFESDDDPYYLDDLGTDLNTVPTDKPLHVVLSKIGGWPNWDQYPAWPDCQEGHRMVFVGQLSYHTHSDASWGGGGHAYLFVCPKTCKKRKGELHIQTT